MQDGVDGEGESGDGGRRLRGANQQAERLTRDVISAWPLPPLLSPCLHSRPSYLARTVPPRCQHKYSAAAGTGVNATNSRTPPLQASNCNPLAVARRKICYTRIPEETPWPHAAGVFSVIIALPLTSVQFASAVFSHLVAARVTGRQSPPPFDPGLRDPVPGELNLSCLSPGNHHEVMANLMDLRCLEQCLEVRFPSPSYLCAHPWVT